MVSRGDGLLRSTVMVDEVGATVVVVVVVVAGVVVIVTGVIGVVGAIGVVGVVLMLVALAVPSMHVSLAVAPCSPALIGSSPIATGTEMTLSAPLTLECA